MTKKKKIPSYDALITWLTSKEERAKTAIAVFAANLVKNPAQQMEHADRAFTAAAEIQVIGLELAALRYHQKVGTDIKTALAEMINYSESEVFRAARFPRNSTSMCSNKMHTEHLSVLALLTEELKREVQ